MVPKLCTEAPQSTIEIHRHPTGYFKNLRETSFDYCVNYHLHVAYIFNIRSYYSLFDDVISL